MLLSLRHTLQSSTLLPTSLLGTMGNLLCVLAHCSGRGEEIIAGDKSHIFLLEQGNVAQVSYNSHFESTVVAGCVMRVRRVDKDMWYSHNLGQFFWGGIHICTYLGSEKTRRNMR